MKFKLFILSAMSIAFLAGCSSHVHTFKDVYTFDEKNHWKEATCEHKEEKGDFGPHSFNENYVCTVCGYEEFDHKNYHIERIEERPMKDYLQKVIKLPELVVELIPENLTFVKYKMYYYSTDLQDNKVLMSSSLTVPYLSGEAYINGFVVDSHPTLTDLMEAPTERWDQYLINCIPGNVVLQCDLMGFGTQSDKISDYHCRHLANRNTVDGIFAAFELIEDEYDVDAENLPLYNVGYSQGGYTSMGFLRYMEQEATPEEKERIKITKTFSGSGAYDINIMFDECFKIEDYQYSHYLIKGILTTYEYHPESYNQYGVTVEDYLTEYGKEFLPPLREKNNAALEEVLNRVDPITGERVYKGPKSVFNQEYLDKESNLNKAVVAACEKENLLDRNWYPKGEIDIYYSPYDTMVTPKCTEAAIKIFKEEEDLDNVGIIEATDKIDHRQYGTTFYISVLIELLANVILED